MAFEAILKIIHDQHDFLGGDTIEQDNTNWVSVTVRSGSNGLEMIRSSWDDDLRKLIILVSSVGYTGNIRFPTEQKIKWLEAQANAAQRLGDESTQGEAAGIRPSILAFEEYYESD